MKVADNQYLYRLETQAENGSTLDYQEIETVEPLRSVGDIHDEIDLENNKQIKRIEEIVFTGESAEYWYNDDTHTTDTHFVAYTESLDFYCNVDHPYCETNRKEFEFGDVHIDENKNFFCTSVELNGMNRIYISIDKSLLAYTVYSHETLKEYFKENPVTVWYVLRYPVEIPRLNTKGYVITHNGSTTIDVQPQTTGKVIPIVKATIEDTAIEMDSVPTMTINNTDEGNQITDLTFEGVTLVNNAKADNIKGTKEVSHTRYDFAPFYDGQTTINNTIEGGYVSAKLYGDTMVNIAKPYGETPLLTATNESTLCDDLLGTNEEGIVLADGEITEGRIYGDSVKTTYCNVLYKEGIINEQTGEITNPHIGCHSEKMPIPNRTFIFTTPYPYSKVIYFDSNDTIIKYDWSNSQVKPITSTPPENASYLIFGADNKGGSTEEITYVYEDNGEAVEEFLAYKIQSVVNPTVYNVNENLFDLDYVFNQANYKDCGALYPSVKIQLKPNTAYYFERNDEGFMNEFKGTYMVITNYETPKDNGAWIAHATISDGLCFKNVKITTGNSGIIYFSIAGVLAEDGQQHLDSLRELHFSNAFLVEDSSTNKVYTPHHHTQATFPYTLNKLPNGVADYIDVVNGVYVQRVGKIVLDGTQTFTYQSNYSNPYYYGYQIDISPYNSVNGKNSICGLCDKLKYQIDYNFGWEAEGEYVVTSTYKLFIKLSKDRLNANNSVESLNSYLQSNPITVLYELKTPIYTPLTDEEKASLPLSAYSNGYIQLSSDELRPSKFEFRAKSSNRIQLDMLETGHYYLNAPTGNVKLGNVDIDVTEMPCLIKVDNASSKRLVVNVADFFYKEIHLNYEEGYLDIANGTISAEPGGRWASDFVEIPYYDKAVYIMNDTKLVDICYYDNNKNFITGVAVGNVNSGRELHLTGNTAAKYMRFSGKNSERVINLKSHVITLSKLPSHRIPTTFTQGMKSSVDFGYWQGMISALAARFTRRDNNDSYTESIIFSSLPNITESNSYGLTLRRITGKYGTTVTVEDEFDISTGKYTKRIGKYVIDGSVAPYSLLEHEEKYNVQKVIFTGGKTGIKPKKQWDNGAYGLAITDLLKFRVDYLMNEPHIFMGVDNINLYFKAGTFGAFTLENVQNYFKENPMTVYYELETPEIIYVDLPQNTIHTSANRTIIETWKGGGGLFPQVKPSLLSYPATLSPNTQYTVFHNRKNYNGSVKTPMINLGGAEVSATGSKTVVTTPSTLAHNELQFIGGENTVEQVMVLHGDWTKEGKTVDYFEGLQSSIIGDKTLENLVDEPTEIWSNKVTSNGGALDYVSMDDIIAVGYGSRAKLPEVQVGTNVRTHGMTLQNLAVQYECIAEPNTYIRTAVYDGVLPAGTYIFFYNVVEPNPTTQTGGEKRFTPYYTCQDGVSYYEGWETHNQTTGLKYWKFTATSPITAFRFWIANIDANCSANNFMLLQYQQGMENWNIPYFEGMKSVENPVYHSVGKNLFDLEYWGEKIVPSSDYHYNIDSNSISGTINGKHYLEMDYNIGVEFLERDTQYTFSCASSNCTTTILFFDTYGNELFAERSINNNNNNTCTFTTPNKSYRAIFRFGRRSTSEGSFDFTTTNIQIEQGTQATEYEPYKESILSTTQGTVLRGVGSYKDVIGWNDGIIRRRCIEFTISGDEGYNWQVGDDLGSTTCFVLPLSSIGLSNKIVSGETTVPCACDKIPWQHTIKDYTHLYFNSTKPYSNSLLVCLEKTKLSSVNSQSVNDYIKSIGGLTIVAPLADTQYEDVEITGGGNWNKIVYNGENDGRFGQIAGEGDTVNGFSVWKSIPQAPDVQDNNKVHQIYYIESELDWVLHSQTNNPSKTHFVAINGNAILVNVRGCHSVDEVNTWLSEHPITVWYQSTSETITNTDVLIFNHGTLYTTTDTHPSTFSDFSLKTTNRYIVKDFDKLKYTVLTEQPFYLNGIDYPSSSTGMTIIDITGIADSSIYSDDTMITVVQDDGNYYADGVLTQFKGEKTFTKEFIRTGNDIYNTGMTLLEPLELCGVGNVADTYSPTKDIIYKNIVKLNINDYGRLVFVLNDLPNKTALVIVKPNNATIQSTQGSYNSLLLPKTEQYQNQNMGYYENPSNFVVYCNSTDMSYEELLQYLKDNDFTIYYDCEGYETIQATPTSTYISTRPENGNIIAQDTQIQAEYLNYDNEQSIISPRMLGDGDEIRWEQGSQCYVYENDNEYIPLTDHNELFGANLQAQEYTQYAESVDGTDIELGVALKEKAVYEQTYVKYEDNIVYPETMENIDETNGVEVDYICGATWQNPNDLSDIRHLGELREDGQYDVTIRRSGDDEIRLVEGTTHISLDYNGTPPSEFELTFFNSGGVEVGKYGDTTHVLEDCVENSKLASGTVYGQTLVNLASVCKLNLSNVSKTETGFKFNAMAEDFDHSISFLNIVKPDTYYTYIFISDTAFEYQTGWDATNSGAWNQPTHQAVVGLNVLRVKTEANTTKTSLLFRTTGNRVGNKDVYLTNFILLEGDYTNVDIPYFEGIHSTVVNGFSSCGKNLWNGNRDVVLETGCLFSQPINIKAGSYWFLGKPNIVYDDMPFIALKNTKTGYSVGIPINFFRATEVAEDCDDLAIYCNGWNFAESNGKYQIIKDFMISTENLIEYEPYKRTTYTLPTPITLRKVGDVCDTFDVVSGTCTQNVQYFETTIVNIEDNGKNTYGHQRFRIIMEDTVPTSHNTNILYNNQGWRWNKLTYNFGDLGDFMLSEANSNHIYVIYEAGYSTDTLKSQLIGQKIVLAWQITPTTTKHILIPSTTQTTQEPTFILPQPLRSLPNGICDRLYWDENKGHYCIEKRVQETILSGKDDDIFTYEYNSYAQGSNTCRFFMRNKSNGLQSGMYGRTTIKCIGSPIKGIDYVNEYNGTVGITSMGENGISSTMRVPSSSLETRNTDGVKKYLKNNPQTFIYPLATPEIIDLPHLNEKVELPTQPNIYPIGYKAVHEKANPEIGLTIPYKVLNMPTQPVNLNFVMDIADYVLTWDDVKEARQYNIILNDEVIATVKEPQFNTGEEMYGYILVEANNEIGDNLSEELYIKTVPNAPAQLTVAHNPQTDYYDFEISFIDTSNIADYYTVMYKVDGGEWVINTIQNSELTTGEKHLWSFSVYEIKESIEVWATATNDVGTNDILPTAIYYMSPTPQWTYRINSKDVFLRWLDESPYDTKYKLRYSYKSNGQFQYAYFEGDAAEIGKLYEAVLPLAEDDEITLALCIISEKENLYCKPVKASKPLDPNIVPPMNFNYHWLARGLIEFYWQDQYDVDVEYEYILESMKANETLWTQVNEIIPSEDVEGTGTIYRVEYQLEDLEQIRMKVRMKWAMNETEWSETLTTVFIPVEGNPPTYIRRTQTAEGLLVEWEAQAYIDSYHIYVIDNETGEELQHLETSDNSILVDLDYSNSIEIAIYEISRFSGGIESDPTDPMVFIPTMFATDIDQRIYQPCAEKYPIEVSTVQKGNKQAYVIHDVSYTPNVETEHEIGVSIATPFTISYHPMMVDVHQAGSRDEHTINAHIKTLDVRNEDLIRVMTFERITDVYDMDFRVYTPSVASYPINLEVSKVRIVCLGDSLTSGHPFYWAETGTGDITASYPYQLSRRLKNQYEVINSGYG